MYNSFNLLFCLACFIFECFGGVSDEVINTIGQAFELKYKEYLNKNPVIQPVVGK